MNAQQAPAVTKYAKLTGTQRTDFTRHVVTAYVAGNQTIRAIADDAGTSYGRVWNTLAASGIKRRPTGTPANGRKRAAVNAS